MKCQNCGCENLNKYEFMLHKRKSIVRHMLEQAEEMKQRLLNIETLIQQIRNNQWMTTATTTAPNVPPYISTWQSNVGTSAYVIQEPPTHTMLLGSITNVL